MQSRIQQQRPSTAGPAGSSLSGQHSAPLKPITPKQNTCNRRYRSSEHAALPTLTPHLSWPLALTRQCVVMQLESSSSLVPEPPALSSSELRPPAGGTSTTAPRSFLPEFADERNRALDREVRVSWMVQKRARGRSQLGLSGRAHPTPASMRRWAPATASARPAGAGGGAWARAGTA